MTRMKLAVWMWILRMSAVLFPRWFVKAQGEALTQSWNDILREATVDGRSVFLTGTWLLCESLLTAVRVRRSPADMRTAGSGIHRGQGGEGMRAMWSEISHALRSLRRSPGFAVAAILTMGLGIGANAAIFSVVHTVLLDPLPYEEPDELVWLMNRYLPAGAKGGISAAEYWEYRQGQSAFEGLVAVGTTSSNLTGLPTPMRLQGMAVSPGYFAMLRVPPAQGRAFLAEEEQPGTQPVVILSNQLWRTAFGADPEIVGGSIELDGRSRTVVGVMPGGFQAPGTYLNPGRRVDFWRPVLLDPATFDELVERHSLFAMARLSDGTDPLAAEQALKEAVRRLETRYPDISNAGSRDVAVTPLRERIVGDATPTLLILSVAVGLVLLVACVNVTSLLMARGEGRLVEAAVRAALGASRRRQFMHAISESVVIGVLGGLCGVTMTLVGKGALASLIPSATAVPAGLRFGGPAVLFTMLVSVLAGLVAGVLPAVRMKEEGIFGSLKTGGERATLGTRRSILKHGLVVGQVAAAVVLVASAGLLIRSLAELRAVDPGFEPEGLLLAQINATGRSYPDAPSIERFYRAVEIEVSALPGVEAVTSSWQTPLQARMSDWPVQGEVSGEPRWHDADPNFVSPTYFQTYEIPVIAGRTFEPGDSERAGAPIVLSRTAARALWGSEDPGDAVGRRVNLDFSEPAWREVIGVVEDAKVTGLTMEPRPQTYASFGDAPFGRIPTLTLTVRTELSAERLRSSLGRILASIDSNVPIGPVQSMESQLFATLERERLLSVMLTMFGVLALVLGAVGVYGLMAYSVRRRTSEIGLRIAMGAKPEGVLGLVIGQGLILGAIGLVFGLAVTMVSSRLLQGFLFGVSRTDVVTLGTVAGVVLAVTALASFIPARRAARVDPLKALAG